MEVFLRQSANKRNNDPTSTGSSAQLCDDQEEWAWWGWAQDGGDICILIADSPLL